jgi:choline dehydrogenase-like flavoprotein
VDFEPKRNFPGTGWPLTLQDLEPYYRRAHEYCDIGAYAYDAATLIPGGREGLLPLDTSLVETVIHRQSPPTRFGRKYREFLERARNVDVMLWANVTQLNMTQSGRIRNVRVQTLEGKSFAVQARVFVLASGAIENARILLASKRPDGVSIGNANDVVGRYYMDHLAGGAAFIALDGYRIPEAYTSGYIGKDRIPLHFLTRITPATVRGNGLLNTSFWWTPYETDAEKRELAFASSRGLRGLKNVAKYALGRDVGAGTTLSAEYCAFINNADEMALALATGASRNSNTILLRFEAEQSPDPVNRVVLGGKADRLGMPLVDLHWAPSEKDIRSIVDSAILVGQAVGKAGLGRLRLEEHNWKHYWDVRTSWHQMGTTRMGRDSRSSVVDTDCRLHDIENLYVAGGSVFPSSGRSNPTLTIVALAVRLAEHLKRRAK